MQSPGYSVNLRSSARTNRGRVRQNNEDNVHLWAHGRYVMAIVADGMGGAAAGEEASRLAIEIIRQRMSEGPYHSLDEYQDVDSADLAQRLREAVIEANDQIVERAVEIPEFKGMGTTLTMIFARNTEVILAHVGDSRAYLVNGHNGDIIQLTADHSFVQALVDAGHITAEEAEEHPMKNVLYRALGQGDSIEVDIHTDLKLHTGDRIVLCSDGLTLHVRAHEIADVIMEEDDPDICSQRLIDLANSRGGRDNISVIVIYADKETPTRNSSHEEESDTRPAPLFKNDEEATLFLRERQLKPTPTKESDEPRNQYVEVTTSETDGEGHDWLNTS